MIGSLFCFNTRYVKNDLNYIKRNLGKVIGSMGDSISSSSVCIINFNDNNKSIYILLTMVSWLGYGILLINYSESYINRT